ncbi:MAG: aminotransferase class I/II-fold pyridoxal phosphate-dependent enzyme [Lachnospiraceae bacterium]|nr:aminotransferase class I/II-fold pyridoxal phosphate-dependent enzyme [Lachnospiraceae bacterium]
MEYQHGGDIYSQEILWDFSANINPLGTPRGVKEAICKAAENCVCYPDSRSRSLVKKLSSFHQIPETAIMCGNGAADLIFQIAFAERPKQGWLLAPGFLEYEQALKAVDAHTRFFFLQREEGFYLNGSRLIHQLSRDLEELHESKNGNREKYGSKLLFLCNPNNPTGQTVKKSDLLKLAVFTKEFNIRLVIDECFLDFCDNWKIDSFIQNLWEFPHAVVLKAFTKRYGMAGVRLGYCLTMDSDLLERMERIRQPWSVSNIAQAAGEAALREQEYLEQTDLVIREGRKQLTEGLKELGFWVCDSQSNYVLFQDLRDHIEEGSLYFKCRQRKLLIRSCKNFKGIDGSYYRVCVKTKEENRILLRILKECLEEEGKRG